MTNAQIGVTDRTNYKHSYEKSLEKIPIMLYSLYLDAIKKLWFYININKLFWWQYLILWYSDNINNNNNNNMTFILRPKMQANSKAHAFVASAGLSGKKMCRQQTL